jgi:hypothetical protein
MSFATLVRGCDSMRARPETEPGSIGSGDGLQSVIPCLYMVSRKSKSPKSKILNRAPRRALKEANHVVSLQAAGMSSTKRAIMAKTDPVRKMWIHGSETHYCQLVLTRKSRSSMLNSRGDCLRPYMQRLRWHTLLVPSENQSGCKHFLRWAHT